MVATSRTLLSRTTANRSFTCAPVNAANLRPPSFVKVKLTSGAFVFVSRPTLAPPARRSPPATAELRVTRYHSSQFSLVRPMRSEEHTSELQSHSDLVCRLLLEKKKSARSPGTDHASTPATTAHPPQERPPDLGL